MTKEEKPKRDYTKLMSGMKSLKPKGDPYSDGVRAICHKPSVKRKTAQKLNSIPKMNSKNREKAILELCSNPMSTALDIQRLIFQVKDRDLTNSELINLIAQVNNFYSKRYGQLNLVQLNSNEWFKGKMDEWRNKNLKEKAELQLEREQLNKERLEFEQLKKEMKQ